jgi:hypothetical protein
MCVRNSIACMRLDIESYIPYSKGSLVCVPSFIYEENFEGGRIRTARA